MRITGGAWRGRRLPELKGFQGRPTTDFGSEGLFNLLSSRVDLEGAQVLDLFAGTGMVSLEFLSRGAGSVTAVERAPKACRFAVQQASQLGSDDLHTVCADVWGFLKKPLTQFDLVFDSQEWNSCPRGLVHPGARRAHGCVGQVRTCSFEEIRTRPFQFVYLRMNAKSSVSRVV